MTRFTLPVPDEVLFPLALRAARRDRVLADEAAQHVRVQFWRGMCDPARPFLPWARTVLRRFCCDALGHRTRAAARAGVLSDWADPRRDLDVADQGLDLTAPFGPEDRATVFTWKPRHRFVLLGWHGLWDKLAAPDQDRTLAAVRPAEPFPVADFLDRPNADRTRYLARALRCAPNTVVKIRRRYCERLLGLRFVRELRGE